MIRPIALGLCASFMVGCSGGGSIPQPLKPVYDPAEVGKAAVAELDKNKNGTIEGAELDASPGLRYAFLAIDKNADRKLSAAEIEKRVAEYPPRDLGVSFQISFDGEPLTGATVTLEREKFMAGSVMTATATTNNDGLAGVYQVQGRSTAELPPGFYRIRITKEGTKIPARYNTKTTLGREVMIEPGQGEITIELALTR